jgi:hypothetical protein
MSGAFFEYTSCYFKVVLFKSSIYYTFVGFNPFHPHLRHTLFKSRQTVDLSML